MKGPHPQVAAISFLTIAEIRSFISLAVISKREPNRDGAFPNLSKWRFACNSTRVFFRNQLLQLPTYPATLSTASLEPCLIPANKHTHYYSVFVVEDYPLKLMISKNNRSEKISLLIQLNFNFVLRQKTSLFHTIFTWNELFWNRM